MNYSNIIPCDLANGVGIRTTLFVSGCDFHCFGCFNKEAQDYNYGYEYTEKVEQEILDYVSDPNVVGLSILGGDPLWQDLSGLNNLIALCNKVHEMGKTVWIWSGFTWEQVMNWEVGEQVSFDKLFRKKLISACDVWVDGRFDTCLVDLSLAWRGSRNQRVIDVQKSLKRGEVVEYGQD